MSDPTKIQTNVTQDRDPTIKRMQGTTLHGNLDFDVPFITQVEGNLWQGGCQNGLILPHFFKHLISLYPWVAYTINHELKSALEIVMYDSLDHSIAQVDALAAWVKACTEDGPTLVHCQAGLNRSGLVAAKVLMLGGMEGWEAIKTLRLKRSSAVLCNPTFERVIRQGPKTAGHDEDFIEAQENYINNTEQS
jgi:protein-tyrosine phosphatase